MNFMMQQQSILEHPENEETQNTSRIGANSRNARKSISLNSGHKSGELKYISSNEEKARPR